MFGLSFDTPLAFLAFAALPLAAWWVFRKRNKPGTIRHPDVRTWRSAVPSWWPVLRRVPDGLRLLALAVFIVALARPQTSDFEILTGEGVDIMIAFDLSASMNAIDMSRAELEAILAKGETPKNRFEIARDTLRDFVSSRREDRVGLVIFGDKAFLKFPLTLDYARVIALLDGLILDSGERTRDGGECPNNCTISGAGTAIGDALSRSYQRLRTSKAKSRMMVLITDGKNEGGKVLPMTVVNYIASRPEEERVPIYTFLIGNDRETFIPVRGVFGNLTYQKPSRPFPTDPELLREIADKTGGKYYESYNEEKFKEDFSNLVKATFSTKTHTSQRDVFAPFVMAGAVLLLLEFALRILVLRKFP